MEAVYTNTPVSPELAARLRAMPKVELHVHLEGATDAATVWELARRNRVTLPAATLEDWQAMYAFRDFNHFIDIYVLSVSCMQTPDDFAWMTERFIQRQAAQNVRYCEVFLSATYMLDKLPLDELIDALAEGAARGEAAYGTRVHFIPDVTRERPETGPRVLDFVLRGQQRGIFIGLGMGGKEIGFPADPLAEVFAEALRHGLHVVAHAGESAGAESVWNTLRSLHAERIGHGVRALEDPELVDHLRRTQIPLEVSPHSNYRLKVVPLDQPHPIRTLVDEGLYVTVNSDDPTMFSTDLDSEYLLLAAQGFTWDELWKLNLSALEASFLADEAKASYQAEWDAFAGA